jgi:hypothetical protein
MNEQYRTNQDREQRLTIIAAAQRIKSIEWNVEWRRDDKLDRCIKQLQEFFRRSALWRQELNCHDIYWPFWDIGLHIDSSIRADEDIINDIKQNLTMLETYICEWHLHWIALKFSGHLDRFTLPDPYEPLIQTYESGSGSMYQEHVFVDIQGCLVPFKKWTEYLQ